MGVTPLLSNVVFFHGPKQYQILACYTKSICTLLHIYKMLRVAPGCLTNVSGRLFHQIIMRFEFGSSKNSADLKHSKLSLFQ